MGSIVKIVIVSGAGTILGQGGQDQSLHCENRFFAVLGLLSDPKEK